MKFDNIVGATTTALVVDRYYGGIGRLVLPGLLLALLGLIAYLNKAYNTDDTWFLLEARQILKTPLQPMSFDICWTNETCVMRAGSLGPGTAQALMGYLLVPVIVAGGAEWIAHSLQIFPVWIAVLELVRLALRLGFDCVQASAAGLLLVAIPPFLPMASTAMPDMAAVAFALTGIERLLAWKNEQRWHQAAVASLTLGLAPYARPHTALLIPIGALWLFDEFQIGKALAQVLRQAYLWRPILIAMCILIAVNLLIRDRAMVYETRNILIFPVIWLARWNFPLRHLFPVNRNNTRVRFSFIRLSPATASLVKMIARQYQISKRRLAGSFWQLGTTLVEDL
jgi:hypothetical protein